jgi:hypothetical protein
LVAESVSLALKVAADVTDTLQRALQITHDRVEQLMTEGDVDPDDLARVRDRNQALEGLRDELAGAAKLSPLMFHPAILSSWHGILRGRFVPGDPSVRVRVVTTHLL